MKVDVVIPTKGEWTLPYCVRSARRVIPINNLILVTTSNFAEQAKKLADICVIFDEKNVGKARAEGLKYVETPFYASIDSDVLVTAEWFKWCSQVIQRPEVAAAQGYARAQGKYYPRIQESYIKRGGKYGKGFCCLGNTLLKTDVVREVGMPSLKVGEDWELRLRIERAGYKWLYNMDIVCPHLKNDVDVWRHAIWWGKMGGEISITRVIHNIGWFATKGLLHHSLQECFFGISESLFLILGKISGKIMPTK